MSINGPDYRVHVSEYAKRHYIKAFIKNYKNLWSETEKSVFILLTKLDNVIGTTNRVEIIHNKDCYKIIKVDFKIFGTDQSAKSSGNRAIVFVDDSQKECRVLLVYSKNDISSPNETQKWQAVIKENYSDIWSKFS